MGVQQTSIDALRDIKNEVPTQELLVLRMYEKHGPMTDQEMARQIHMAASLVSARRGPLVTKGYVVDLGKRPCRVTGRRVIVWGLKEAQRTLF